VLFIIFVDFAMPQIPVGGEEQFSVARKYQTGRMRVPPHPNRSPILGWFEAE
jgi:hypothetical protein